MVRIWIFLEDCCFVPLIFSAFLNYLFPLIFLVWVSSVSVWKGLIQCSWIKRGKGFSGASWAFTSPDVLLSHSVSLCYWEMSGHIKNFLLSLTWIYLGQTVRKLNSMACGVLAARNLQKFGAKKADQVWIHAWDGSRKISWVSVNRTDNNYQSSSDKPVFSVNSSHNKKFLVDLRFFTLTSLW